MKSRCWIILGIGIAVLIALMGGLILVNFSAMSSQTNLESEMATSTGGSQTGQPFNPPKTGLLVTGENQLAPALQNQIIHVLQSEPAFGQIEVLTGIIDRIDYPLLLIEIDRQEILWTPIYGRANLKVNVAYASDGDVSFRLTQPTKFTNSSDQPSLKRSGNYTIFDVSWGIITRPGYMNYLAKEIARHITADLKGQN